MRAAFLLGLMGAGLVLGGCAGQFANPEPVDWAMDKYYTCQDIRAEKDRTNQGFIDRHVEQAAIRQRDNDLKVHERLKERYTRNAADIIMPMLQSLPPNDLGRPETYEALIDYLTNANTVIRELAYGHLYYLVPAGREIRYDVTGPPDVRQRAQEAYRKLIPRGKLPPRPPRPAGAG